MQFTFNYRSKQGINTHMGVDPQKKVDEIPSLPPLPPFPSPPLDKGPLKSS